jgi:hypothetical protein
MRFIPYPLVVAMLASALCVSCGSGDVRSDSAGGGPPTSAPVTCPGGPGGGSSSVSTRWCRQDGIWYECGRDSDWHKTGFRCQ